MLFLLSSPFCLSTFCRLRNLHFDTVTTFVILPPPTELSGRPPPQTVHQRVLLDHHSAPPTVTDWPPVPSRPVPGPPARRAACRHRSVSRGRADGGCLSLGVSSETVAHTPGDTRVVMVGRRAVSNVTSCSDHHRPPLAVPRGIPSHSTKSNAFIIVSSMISTGQ